MFEAWDMLTGRLHPELGGDESMVDIIGVNFYDRNQWRNYGSVRSRFEKANRPFLTRSGKLLARVMPKAAEPFQMGSDTLRWLDAGHSPHQHV